MPDQPITIESLTSGAQSIFRSAVKKQQDTGQPALGINHWMSVLIERYRSLIESMAVEFNTEEVSLGVKTELEVGHSGPVLLEQEVLLRAAERARRFAKSQPNERDIVAVVLSAAGYPLKEGYVASTRTSIENTALNNRVTALTQAGVVTPPISSDIKPTGDQNSSQQAQSTLTDYAVSLATQEPNEQYTYHLPALERAKKPVPVLKQFGRDMTQDAIGRKFGKLIGREQEIQLIIETLCRRTKRNPLLVGPAGVGKTAIVEGLALRFAEGTVPEVLQGSRIFAIQPSILVAGASISGELEKRMKAVILEASQDGIILFLDELHSAIGAGGTVGTNDVASILKPALARGELACIAATTDDEYRRYIEPDSALERRFQPLRIQELPAEQTYEVLISIQDKLSRSSQIQVDDKVLHWLVDFGREYMRNRYFPDKAVDLLEQCFAHTLMLAKDRIDLEDAQEVAQRMVGMPLALSDRLMALEKSLSERSLLSEQDTHVLLNRLQVTMRGLDFRTNRPNAVVLLSGKAAEASAILAEVIAQSIFGAIERVVTIDCSRFGHPEDINLLVGAPPGYVGYSDSLPIHRILQIPWCVLLFDNIDVCHPQVREVITRALADGFIIDGRGKVIFLSDTIVLLTAQLPVSHQQNIGFTQLQSPEAVDLAKTSELVLGPELTRQFDLIAINVEDSRLKRRVWLEKYLLVELNQRYKRLGILLVWDESVITWLTEQNASSVNEREWEKIVDGNITPSLIPFLSIRSEIQELTVTLKYGEGGFLAQLTQS